jgi:cysteine desulfuration protein SufE
MFIKADSDARITRGMLALIIRVLNGQSPGDIAASDLYFIERSGLASHLSPSRANGLYSVVESIKSLAKKMLHEHVEKDLSGEK